MRKEPDSTKRLNLLCWSGLQGTCQTAKRGSVLRVEQAYGQTQGVAQKRDDAVIYIFENYSGC